MQAGLLVTEANLAEPSLAAVCAMAGAAGVPVFLEPVSVPKSKRWVRPGLALRGLVWPGMEGDMITGRTQANP